MPARRLWLIGIPILIAIGAALLLWRPAEDEQRVSSAPSAGSLTFGGPFTLVDHTGRTVTEKDFLGRYQLVFFGFTQCAAVCPTTLQTISLAMNELGELADSVQPLFISIDPERDTAELLAEYVSYFDKRIVGLTGTPSQVGVAAKAFHIYYRRVRDKDGSEQIDHTATMFFMGPDGKYLTFIHPDASPQKIAQVMKMKMENSTKMTSRRE